MRLRLSPDGGIDLGALRRLHANLAALGLDWAGKPYPTKNP